MIFEEDKHIDYDQKKIDIADVRRKALDLLARREHSRLELSRKLHKKYSEYQIIEDVLDQLELDSLLSDDRFTEEYVKYRKDKGFGPIKISAELRERGIGETKINKYLDTDTKSWFAEAKKVRQKKFGIREPDNFNEKIRQQKFLMYRGFLQEHISGFVDL